MRITVLLFAGLREAVGQGRVDLELPEPGTIADALRALSDRHGALSDASFATARNQVYAPVETVLADGDELALIPPVSGG